MIAWVSTDDTGHIVCSVVTEDYASEDMTRIEVDDDFDWNVQADYVLKEDGSLVYDGAWTAKLEQERRDAAIAQETEDQLKVAARMFVQSATTLTDEQARSVSHLHREWKVGDTYAKGQIIIYKGELYRCVKDPNDGKIYESKIPNNVWGPPSEQPEYWRKVPED